MLFLTIHHDLQGMVKTHMANILRLLNRRHTVKNLLLEDTVTRIGVNGEIAYPKGGKVLEEVSTLRGIYMIILQSRFYYDTRCRNMGPFDRYTQPIVAAASPSGTNQHIVFISIQKFAVYSFYLIGYIRVVGSCEIIIRLDIDDIDHILRNAMSQGVL